MSWWSRLTGGSSHGERRTQRLDYLNEALALERQGDYDAALTSYRLALRDKPNDTRVLLNMAIAFSKTGQQQDAIRSYRRTLELDPSISAAHYGLGFLLLRKGATNDAAYHFECFLMSPPAGPESERWVKHARETLDNLKLGETVRLDGYTPQRTLRLDDDTPGSEG